MLRVTRSCVIALDELEWRFTRVGRSGRPAREHVEHEGRAALRHRGLAVARAAPAGAAPRAARPARARRRVGAPVAAPEPRARARTAARAARGRAARRPAARRRPSRRARRSGARVEQKRRHGERKRTPAPPRRTRTEPTCTSSASVAADRRRRRRGRRSCSTPRSARSCCRAARPCCSRSSCSAPCGACFMLFARPRRELRSARPRHGAVRADRAARVPGRLARRRVRRRSRASSTALESDGWRDAFDRRAARRCSRSGSSGRPSCRSAFVAFAEAAIGLGAPRAVIAYLPTIYSAFSRREVAVTDSRDPRRARRRRRWSMLERAHRTGFLDDLDPFWDEWMTWFAEVQETHTSLGVARVLPFAEPAPLVDHRRRRGARHRRAPARGAQHPVDARRRGCASARATSRCARSRASSASTTTPTPRPTIRSASRARSSTRSTSALAARGRAGAAPTASRPGATSRAGGSTTTRVLLALGRVRHGSVRAVVVGSFVRAAAPSVRVGAASARRDRARAGRR